MTTDNQTPEEEVTLGRNIVVGDEVRTLSGWKKVSYRGTDGFNLEGQVYTNDPDVFYIVRVPEAVRMERARVAAMEAIIEAIHNSFSQRTAQLYLDNKQNPKVLQELADEYRHELANEMVRVCDEWAAQEVAKFSSKQLNRSKIIDIVCDSASFQKWSSDAGIVAREVAERIVNGEANA